MKQVSGLSQVLINWKKGNSMSFGLHHAGQICIEYSEALEIGNQIRPLFKELYFNEWDYNLGDPNSVGRLSRLVKMNEFYPLYVARTPQGLEECGFIPSEFQNVNGDLQGGLLTKLIIPMVFLK